ncbi:hypothetical protein [Streptomyces sp. NPDC086519]|uniref:hypothetical protein n=1 Tax=Streptomyces sp. NPDC086519 TaxID=3154863 RepID=UPI003430B837
MRPLNRKTTLVPSSLRGTTFSITLAFFLAGCAGAGGGAKADGKPDDARNTAIASPPSVVKTYVFDSAQDKPLPLDQYLMNWEQLSVVAKAQAKIVSGCMARFGFNYSFPVSLPPRTRETPATRIDGRYGPQNATLMAKWGYHPEGGVHADKSQSAMQQPDTAPGIETVLRGTSDTRKKFGAGGQVIHGQKVPDHGCIGDAAKKLTGSIDDSLVDPQIAVDLKLQTLIESQRDRRTEAVFSKWSLCMKGKGFSYPNPLAAVGDTAWVKTAMPTAHELRTATADADCRHKNNVVGVWYAVDRAYQEQAIAANAAVMAKVKAGLTFKVKAARQTLAG